MKRITLWATIAATMLLAAASVSAQNPFVINQEPDFNQVENGKTVIVKMDPEQVFNLVKDALNEHNVIDKAENGTIRTSPNIEHYESTDKKKPSVDVRTVIVIKVVGLKDGTTMVKVARLAQESYTYSNHMVIGYGTTWVDPKGTDFLLAFYTGEKSPFAKAVVKDSNEQPTATAPPTPKPKPKPEK